MLTTPPQTVLQYRPLSSEHMIELTKPEPIREIDILWITAGLGCDGDTISRTAATQPSLDEILPGGIPGTPDVRLHNPFLSYENGNEFMEAVFVSGVQCRGFPTSSCRL